MVLNVIRCRFCAAAHWIFTVLILFVMSLVGANAKTAAFRLNLIPRAFNSILGRLRSRPKELCQSPLVVVGASRLFRQRPPVSRLTGK